MKHIDLVNVGAQDPELKNSPVVDSELEEGEFFDIEMGTEVCFFNGKSYPCGEYVCSGAELLRCEKGGVWVRKGSCYE